MLGQHAQAICALEKHFPTVMHVQHKTGTSDEQGQHAKDILKDLQSVSQLHDGCHKRAVNTQQDLS